MENQTHRKILSDRETASFCSQMAMILNAGISSLEGISILLEDAADPREKALLEKIYETIIEKGQLAPALAASGMFPDYMVHMTEIGEETGRLDEVMESLAEHYNREEAITRSIKSALTYPMVMIGMMLIVILILITQVVPVFQQVFRQLGYEMTGLSRGILLIGNTLSAYAYIFIGIALIIILFFIYLTKTEKGRKTLAYMGQHFRFTREIYEKRAVCRFAGGISLALKSGMTPEQGLDFSANLVDDDTFTRKIVSCRNMIEEGSELADALLKSRIFSGVYARMTSIAGKAGTIDEVMAEIADRCEEEVNEKITSFIAVLEPTLVIILSVIVGIILLSVMLPLLGIMSGL